MSSYSNFPPNRTNKESDTKKKNSNVLLAEVCWWSYKVCRYEDAGNEVTGKYIFKGYAKIDKPLNVLSSSDDASTAMDID